MATAASPPGPLPALPALPRRSADPCAVARGRRGRCERGRGGAWEGRVGPSAGIPPPIPRSNSGGRPHDPKPTAPVLSPLHPPNRGCRRVPVDDYFGDYLQGLTAMAAQQGPAGAPRRARRVAVPAPAPPGLLLRLAACADAACDGTAAPGLQQQLLPRTHLHSPIAAGCAEAACMCGQPCCLPHALPPSCLPQPPRTTAQTGPAPQTRARRHPLPPAQPQRLPSQLAAGRLACPCSSCCTCRRCSVA